MVLPYILAGAGILDGLLKSQQYYKADEVPSRAQLYGGALGKGLGGYIGGGQLSGSDPLGILGNLIGGRPQDIQANDVANLPDRQFGDPANAQHGTPGYTPIQNFGRAEKSDSEKLIDFLTNGGGIGQYTRPRNQAFGGFDPFSIFGNLGGR